MMKYKGYYIDHITFDSKADVDNFLKDQAISKYMAAVKMFAKHSDMEHSIFVDKCANVLHDQFGFTWNEIEQIEIEALKTA